MGSDQVTAGIDVVGNHKTGLRDEHQVLPKHKHNSYHNFVINEFNFTTALSDHHRLQTPLLKQLRAGP
jgi:hypothetical protein